MEKIRPHSIDLRDHVFTGHIEWILVALRVKFLEIRIVKLVLYANTFFQKKLVPDLVFQKVVLVFL